MKHQQCILGQGQRLDSNYVQKLQVTRDSLRISISWSESGPQSSQCSIKHCLSLTELALILAETLGRSFEKT